MIKICYNVSMVAGMNDIKSSLTNFSNIEKLDLIETLVKSMKETTVNANETPKSRLENLKSFAGIIPRGLGGNDSSEKVDDLIYGT